MTKEKRMRMKKEKRRLRNKDKRRISNKKEMNLMNEYPSYLKTHLIPNEERVHKETYGCEVVTDLLSTNQKKILEKIGLGDVLSVKRRDKGLTSSGIGGECHSNVRKLVELCGGKQLIGFGVQTNVYYKGEICLQFMGHSVWITPEGELVDPTVSSNDHKYNFTNFIPINVYQEDNVWTHLMDMMFPKDFEKSGYILQGDKSEPNDMRLPFESLRWETSVGSMKCTDEEINSVLNGNGGFTKPSLSTGKTYDELLYNKQYELLRSSLLSSFKMFNPLQDDTGTPVSSLKVIPCN